FKNADEESIWVRVPVISYLQACPLPKAKQYIAELAQIDPDAVKRANSFFPLNAASAPSASAADAKPDAAAADAADSAQPAGTAPAEGSASAKPATATSDAAAGGKKVSGPAPAAPPAGPTAPPPGKKTTQVQKPVGDAQASSDKKNRGAAARSRGSSAQTAGRLGARLSRSSAPQLAPQVGLWSVLGYLTLAGGVLAIFLQAILRGGQQASA
ncbi:MAG TPA: hypothetical protein VG433_00315, partial [Pirellulales bacterium]|nr:hypothetical protein [Pirellulales bacterium]